MTSAFDKLNLRPFERRLVVVVAIALFLVVQILFVWPHFGDLTKMSARRGKASQELAVRETEIAQTNKFVKDLKAMEGEGLAVPPEDQTAELMRAIQSQAAQSGVTITANSKPTTRTNQFFLEQSQQITTISDEAALVNFLYNLGAGNSLIRVRDLTVRPDQTRTRLTATVKLVASYQKKTAVRTGAASPKASAPKNEPKPAVPKPAPGPVAPRPAVQKPGAPKPAPPTSSPATRKLP